MSNVELKIEPLAKDLGDNFNVRRSLPKAQKRMVGPFIFWDHMGPVHFKDDKAMTVRAHPHIGLATITYLFNGEIMHRDSLGNEQPIRPGEVNWMTAGKGIVHSERTHASSNPMELEGIQLWLALPQEKEDVDPSFVHEKEENLPLLDKEGMQIRLIAGSAFNSCSPIPVYSDLFYMTATGEPGSSFVLDLGDQQEAGIYVIDGEIEVEGQAYTSANMVIFKKGSSVEFKVTEKTQVMIFGGDVFEEGRHIWWNFVSSSKEKIERAKEMWKNGEFPPVINETERIPLPEN